MAEKRDAPDETSLTWLADLRARLSPAVELVREDGSPLLPAPGGEVAIALRRLLEPDGAPLLKTAIRRAVLTGEPEFLKLEGLRIEALGLDDGSGLALVFGELLGSGPDEDREAELDRFGHWLARAIKAQRAAFASETEREWQEIAALHRLFTAAAANGTGRDVVYAFIEALAVWTDIDARAYRGDLSGRFRMELALPGADQTRAPARFESDPIPGRKSARLSTAEAEQLGFAHGSSVILTRVREPRAAPWILAHLGSFGPRDEARLGIFADVLQSFVHTAAEVEASRLMWAIVQQLVSPPSPKEIVVAAVREIAEASASLVAVSIARPDGSTVLCAESEAGALATGDMAASVQAAYRLQLPPGFEGRLTMRRPNLQPLTRDEDQLAEIAVETLSPWLTVTLDRGELQNERRSARSSFEQDIDARMANLAGSGSDVSLVLIQPPSQTLDAPLLQTCIGEIRRQLRPFDGAGALGTGEIGLLLSGTSATGAVHVVQRLRQSFSTVKVLGSLAGAHVGIASRAAGDAHPPSLVEKAREALAQRSS